MLIRYCDDFVVGFQYRADAERFGKLLKERLSKYGLEIAEEKSKIIEFGRKAWEKGLSRVETFDFLGFTHYCDTSRTGRYKVTVKTSIKKYRQKLKAMNEWMKRNRNILPLYEGYWEKVKQKLRGHYEYYGRSGNYRMIKRYYERTVGLAWKWINRRSNRESYNLEQYTKFLKYNPLPRPKITHSIYIKT
jgi:sulfur relay (sulfurtransferase) DsrC/TusE family protein